MNWLDVVEDERREAVARAFDRTIASLLAPEPSGTVRCQQCPWVAQAHNIDEAMVLFEAHTFTGHAQNPYVVGASFSERTQ